MFEINTTSAYIYISCTCIIGFMFGLWNWSIVSSIELKNNPDEKDGEVQEIPQKKLDDLIDSCRKISEVII